MNKSRVFYTFGWLLTSIQLFLTILLWTWISSTILATITALIFFVIVAGMVGAGLSNLFSTYDFTISEVPILLFRRKKRLVHSELGEFIMIFDYFSNKKIRLYRYGYIHLEFIGKFPFPFEDPNKFPNIVIEYITNKFQEELKNIRQEKYELEQYSKAIEQVKDWDGIIDIQGKRESKLEKLGI